MGKIATTVEEQIQMLKDRKMSIDLGDKKAKEILLDIGYYRLGFYWNPFEIDEYHNFEIDTKFSDVVKLYYLDADLKHLLSKALNRIEINFKTQLIYYVSNKYNRDPIWFVNKKIVSKDFVSGFNDIYNKKFIANNNAIKKHHNKHPNDKYAPAWKTLEYLTLGSIIKLYLSISNKNLQEKIAHEYNIKSLKVFENYIQTILFIRNICAHSDLLFDSYTPMGIKSSPMVNIENNKRHCLASSIEVINYFLSKISKNRANELEGEVNYLFVSFYNNKKIKEIIQEKIGHSY